MLFVFLGYTWVDRHQTIPVDPVNEALNRPFAGEMR